jgi:hypothetical protein
MMSDRVVRLIVASARQASRIDRVVALQTQ